MPLYEYVCEECQYKFDLLRGFACADDPAICPRCERPSGRRLLSRFAAVSKGGDGSSTSIAGSGSCASCGASSCAGCKH